VTYGTSEAFLSHFGLDAVGDLPGSTSSRARACSTAAAAGLLGADAVGRSGLRDDEDPLNRATSILALRRHRSAAAGNDRRLR
jgi:segregation and condensation protein B